MKITIKGIHPYDGTYHAGASFDEWTNREWAILKRVAGVLPLGVEDALRGGDMTVVTAIAIVALRRTGRFAQVIEDVLWDAPATAYRLDLDDDEEPADPSPQSEPDTPGTPSGSPSPDDSASPGQNPARTGIPSSDTPASDLATSTT